MLILLIRMVVAATIGLVSSPEVIGQGAVTSPPPAQVILVTNGVACTLTKHPTLPVLYLTGSYAPASKNLFTVRLNADGSLVADSQKAWPDYFTTNPTNHNFLYSIPRPVVLADEKVLYLAALPAYDVHFAETNNNTVAVVGLDDQGQPAKLLKAFRPTHTELGIRALGWDFIARRLYLGYRQYFGWCQMDKAGLPVSEQFQWLNYPNNFWNFVYRPEWHRFYGYHASFGFYVVKMAEDGPGYEFIQYLPGGTGGRLGNIVVSPRFLKLYLLDDLVKRIQICQLTGDGRLTSVPKFFPLADDTTLIRFDFKAALLYALTEGGILRVYHLSPAGYPTGAPQISQLAGRGVRDAVVDEATGKLYVACTVATLPAK